MKYTKFNTKTLQSLISPFSSFKTQWMLITSGVDNLYPNYNTLTASWGGFGYIWESPVAFAFVRPTRHSFSFLNENELMSLSFFDNKYKKQLLHCGNHSGKDGDKIKQCGLNAISLEHGLIGFKEAKLTLKCKKLYTQDLKEENFLQKDFIQNFYPIKDFHRMYISEIQGFYTA